MNPVTHALTHDERIRSSDLLYVSLLHEHERRIGWIALGLALALHVAALATRLPELVREVAQPEPPRPTIVVRKYIPPPPRIEQRTLAQRPITRKVPLPDPTPDEPEPIREPEPEIIEDMPVLDLPLDVDVILDAIGEPPPPPQTAPLLAGAGGVSNPELIPGSRVVPEYPELARMGRIEGRVILQALIHGDGTVGEVTVLRCNRPAVGFEDSAIAAVQQWRYEPATFHGRPVEVYFTVIVEFVLEHAR